MQVTRRVCTVALLMVVCAGAFAAVHTASAYYGQSYTYYLKDDDNNKAYVRSSGYWDQWNGSLSLSAISIRIDVDVWTSSSQMSCWYTNITAYAWQFQKKDSTFLHQNNTPWYHTEPWSVVLSYGIDATFEVATAGVSGQAGCDYWQISLAANNAFIVPVGTNYNNQGNAGEFTAFP